MWELKNATPFAAGRSWVQDKDANKHWLVVVKASFDILSDGSCRLAAEQLPVFEIGQPYGEFGTSSLSYEADLFGVKSCTDILVRGNAWVGGGRKACSVDVVLSVGPIKKCLRVFGDRYWERSIVGSLMASKPQEFESMAVTFERAYGGWDRVSENVDQHRLEARNPVGTGFATCAEHCLGMRLPNIEYPGELIGSWKDRPAPAGLNAVDCSWSPRRELAGTYDERWRKDRFPLWAEDFDPRYNNCAPRDQQVHGFLAGGEIADLVNLSATGRLLFRLPRVLPRFRTRFGRKRVDHQARLCTVLVEPDLSRLVMSWQTNIVCHGRMDELDETLVTESSYLEWKSQ